MPGAEEPHSKRQKLEHEPLETRIFHGLAQQKLKRDGREEVLSSVGQASLVFIGDVILAALHFPKEFRNPALPWSRRFQFTKDASGRYTSSIKGELLNFSQSAGELKGRVENLSQDGWKIQVQFNKLNLLTCMRQDPNAELRGKLASIGESVREFACRSHSSSGADKGTSAGKSVTMMLNVQNLIQGLVRGCRGEGTQASSSSSAPALADASLAARRVCVIGATGTGKSSLVNALLGQRVAISAGKGRAVTCVPTEYFFRLPHQALQTVRDSAAIDLVGSLADSVAIEHGSFDGKPTFTVALHFLSAAEVEGMLADVIDELVSPVVTKSEKERACLPTLRVLFNKELDHLPEQLGLFSMEPDTPEDVIAKKKLVLSDAVRSQLMSKKDLKIPSVPALKRSLMFGQVAVRGCDLVGQRLTGELYTLDTLRELEDKYVRILEHVEVGADFPLLKVPDGIVRLIDVPGFGDENGVRERVAEKYLSKADKILICAGSARAGSDRQTKEYLKKDAVQELQMKNAGRGTIVFCATKSDQVTKEELESMDSFEDDPARLRELYNEQVRHNIKTMLEDFKYGSSIPVFVVSSERYMSINGLMSGESSDFTSENTEIPDLSRQVYQSIWEECTAEQTKQLQYLKNFCEDAVRTFEEGGDGAGECPARASASDIAEVVQEVLERAVDEAKSFKEQLASALSEFQSKLAEMETWVRDAATSANRATSDVVSGWGSMHWSTYAATLRKGGEHTGARGQQDFHADLFRNFRQRLQDQGWSEFFDRYRAHLLSFTAALRRTWLSIASTIKEAVKASRLADDDKKMVVKEMQRRAELSNIDVITTGLSDQLAAGLRHLQDQLDSPREAIKEAYSSTYSAIGHGESGTGSHARRKARVSSTLAHGCEMEGKIDRLLQQQRAVLRMTMKLPEKVISGLRTRAKCTFGRGSWSADMTECPICLDSSSSESWSVIFPCSHAAHTSCLEQSLRDVGLTCPVCRGEVVRSNIEIVTKTKEKEPTPQQEVELALKELYGILSDLRGLLHARQLEPVCAACGGA